MWSFTRLKEFYYTCFPLGTVWTQSAQDDATVQMAGDDLDIPEELAKMVDEDEEQEELNDSFLGKLQNMDVDFDSIKAKAQSTMTEVKQAAEDKCVMMWLFS